MLANPFKYRTCSVHWNDETVRIRSYRRDHITKALKRGGFYEIDFLAVIAEKYAGSGVFVDVGAFVGNHSLFFSRHCGAEKVFAFEPFPETYSLLCHNVRSNSLGSVVTCFNKAVSDSPGTLSMSIVDKKNRGMNRIDDNGDVSVEVTTLDRELNGIDEPIRFLKVDAEGHGSKVIDGAREVIAKHRPVIAIEVDPEPLDRISSLLAELGYEAISCHNYTPTWVFEHESMVMQKAA